MVHFVLGVWGVMAANDRYPAVVFTRAAAVLLAILGIAGLVPLVKVNTAYGTMPLSGVNAWLHLGTAIAAAFFAIRPGYRISTAGMRRQINPHRP
jgi:hypothetical protein